MTKRLKRPCHRRKSPKKAANGSLCNLLSSVTILFLCHNYLTIKNVLTYNSKVDIHIAASNVVDLTRDCLLCVVLPNRLNPLRCNYKIIIEEDKSIYLRAVRLFSYMGSLQSMPALAVPAAGGGFEGSLQLAQNHGSAGCRVV